MYEADHEIKFVVEAVYKYSIAQNDAYNHSNKKSTILLDYRLFKLRSTLTNKSVQWRVDGTCNRAIHRMIWQRNSFNY